MNNIKTLNIVLVILFLLTIFLIANSLKLNKINKSLLQAQVKSQEIIVVLQEKINDLLDEIQDSKEDHLHFGTMQTDNTNLISAITSVSNVNRFYPDFMPIQGEYAISQNYYQHHRSVDLSTSKGANVYAAGAGVVIACYDDKYLGNVILIDHLNSYKTLYAHLDQFKVSINTFIEKGQVIGLVGNTGNSTSPHLHFQIYHQNEPMDPSNIMKISKFKN